MSRAWIQLQCPECQETWETAPSDLPPPGNRYRCDHCQAQRSVAEFAHTKRDYEIIAQFHQS